MAFKPSPLTILHHVAFPSFSFLSLANISSAPILGSFMDSIRSSLIDIPNATLMSKIVKSYNFQKSVTWTLDKLKHYIRGPCILDISMTY